MNVEIKLKLWVMKFCIKVIYPKFEPCTFLVFLAIKYRLYLRKKLNKIDSIMEAYKIKTVTPQIQKLLLIKSLGDNLKVLSHKCLVVSREEFIEISTQNLFYSDNGALWVMIKLHRSCKNKEDENGEIILPKYDLSVVSNKIHNALWTDSKLNVVGRIVPIVGSQLVKENGVFTTENELHNIISTFRAQNCKDFRISLHPVPSMNLSPKIAATAEVSFIECDYELSNDFLKEILSNHFESPKLITLNDIISIDLTPEMTMSHHFKYLDLVENTGKLYFKCTKLSGEKTIDSLNFASNNILEAFYLVKGVTQLSLGDSVHDIKPKDEYFHTKDVEMKSISPLKKIPSGLKEKFDQIQETISPFLSGEINELSELISSPIIPLLLVTGPQGSGRHVLVKTLAKYNGVSYVVVDCNSLQSSTAKQTESRISSAVQRAKAAAPAIVLLDHFDKFGVDPENNEDCRVVEYFVTTITELYQNYTKFPIVFIALAETADLKPNILRMFLDKFYVTRMTAQQRLDSLLWFASAMQLKMNESDDMTSQDESLHNYKDQLNAQNDYSGVSKEVLQRIASKTGTFLHGELDALVQLAAREAFLNQHNLFNQLAAQPDLRKIGERDFNAALECMRSLQSQQLDAPKIPKVYWEDIGGMEYLKKELLKTIEFPIKYPHLFNNSTLKRSGIMLYGPPGCGKTLVAKAVSTELSVSFLSVKGPELLNMYVGQSEENVRRVFSSARSSSPCIVFLDELEALAPRRGASADSGGASDRVVSQLLAELDAVITPGEQESGGLVFVLGATNRPDLVERSLMRPGRLDKLLYVGPYQGEREKTTVLAAACRRHKLSPNVRLSDISTLLPDKVTGADLMSVVSTARAHAVRNLLEGLKNGSVSESSLSADSVLISDSDLRRAAASFRPSVSPDELAYYEGLQSQL